MHGLLKTACLLGAVGTMLHSASAEESARTISVTGEGEATASPDMATIETGVVTQAKTAEEALEANNEQMEQIMDALAEYRIAQKDIQTSNFNVNPVYKHDRQSGREPEVVAYRVQNQVQVHVRELSRLGDVLDELVQAGSNRISGIRFGVDDETGLLNQARSRAVRDAKSRADVYAQAAGVEVGRVLQISEQPVHVPRPQQLSMQAARAEASRVPVATGEQEFRVTVHVVYELQEARGADEE